MQAIESARLSKLEALESVIRKSEKHVENFIDAFREIRDSELYLSKGFTTFADYCQKEWKKSVRAVQLALQLDDVRKSIAERATHDQDPQTKALAKTVSDRAVRKLAGLPKEKQIVVLKAAAKATNGKPTGKAVARAAAQIAHRPLPKGGLAADALRAQQKLPPLQQERREYNPYSSAPATGPTVKLVESSKIQAVEEYDMEPVVDAETAVARVQAIYERDKAWFNALPPRTPKDIVDRLVAGLRE